MTIATKLPALSAVANAVLKSKDGAEVVAKTLWAKQAVAVLVIRRPGCVLCRDEAQRLWALKPEFDKINVGLVCVVHEWIQREIDAFAPSFWPGPLYHDTSKAFYAALNGGTPLRGSLLPLANPFGAVWGRIRAAARNVKEHNVNGDGLTMGGLLLMRSGEGGPAWLHLETEIGLLAEPAAVLHQAQRMVAAA
ncbi:hypothetical protein HYH02_011795 [Chlamydomonas schloesseri]|uniref:Peroxiredoxin-like 2A n=1 Tax=Chlamydomonas schloesseri TaxID=2026947 RepID=A0A835TCK9_9CHLO|nr:hypothetical protein HYH02_011795 [Chlamydomonas schloesseri]|eukprot:KAG2435500.1 hypothetical protein HYH02_011795 [Chlamydomonas schloesseri]